MKRLLGLMALAGAVLMAAAPLPADDGFYVIGGRPQLGTKITSLPYTISASGYYYLAGNLYYAGGNGITVDADNVTIDLMGFCLTGPYTNNYNGILIKGRNNVEIRNGTIRGWYMGITDSPTGSTYRIIGVRGNRNYDFIFFNGGGHLVKGCTALGTNRGIYIAGSDSIVSNSVVMNDATVQNLASDGISLGSGAATGNVVLNCSAAGASGINATGVATISYNSVINCSKGINAAGGGSLVGNVVDTNINQTGIVPSTNTATPNLLDQNAVGVTGTLYGPGSTATVWGINGGH